MSLVSRCATIAIVAQLALLSNPLTNNPAWADGIRDNEWHLTTLHIDKAQLVTKGEGTIVGVIDSGVDATHRDLTYNVLPGTDLIEKTDGRQDLEGHGTIIAGIIAGHGNSNGGVLGIAPEAKILPVRIFSHTAAGVNGGYPDGGFTWATQHGARVICASFGAHETPGLRADVDAAIAAGVVVVAAAGNKPDANSVNYPAALPGVVAVGGITENGQHDTSAVSGEQILISAPSVAIESTYKHNSYAISSGTSDAAAIVAGVAALVRAKYPTMSAAEVVHRLTATATDKGPPGRDPDYGYGIVNPVAALTADVPPLSSAGSSPAPVKTETTRANPTGPSTSTVALLGVALLAVATAGLSVAVIRRRNTGAR